MSFFIIKWSSLTPRNVCKKFTDLASCSLHKKSSKWFTVCWARFKKFYRVLHLKMILFENSLFLKSKRTRLSNAVWLFKHAKKYALFQAQSFSISTIFKKNTLYISIQESKVLHTFLMCVGFLSLKIQEYCVLIFYSFKVHFIKVFSFHKCWFKEEKQCSCA